MKQGAFLLLVLPVLACASTIVEQGSTPVAIGKTVNVDGPKVTPLEVLEDSRCPVLAQCVWAGRVRIKARVATGAGSSVRELELSKAISVADGQLTLATVLPAKTSKPIALDEYRFTFSFAGGL